MARHFSTRVRMAPYSIIAIRSPFRRGLNRKSATGAIVSRGDDYSEGQQHGLYLMDGKLRLHVTFRWTDLAMRVETVDPVPLDAWSHVAVSYDGGMRAAGVRMYVDGKPQQAQGPVRFAPLADRHEEASMASRRRRRTSLQGIGR